MKYHCSHPGHWHGTPESAARCAWTYPKTIAAPVPPPAYRDRPTDWYANDESDPE